MDFKEIIQKVKNEYNITDYVRMNGMVLESAGNGSWKALCPFHSENTPSFHVNEDFQNYKCFGCGESGDVIKFAENIHTVSFTEALRMLAEEKGIEIKNVKSEGPSHDITGIRRVVEDARVFYRKNYESLDNSHPAKQEVIKRGLDVNNPLYGFSLEAPNQLYKYLKDKGHSDENIKDSNLVLFYDNREPWDFFHGRLMITLSDYMGRPISFTSRKIYSEDRMEGKYVNGKESPVFIKKSNLFGADLAKKEARAKKLVYVVEGQFDQISMFEKGVKNVVGTSGTSFTSEHANALLRMVGNSGRIVFVMDGDIAGAAAAVSVFSSQAILHSKAFAVHLDDGKDPCDYIVEGGIEHLLGVLETATTLHDFVIEYVLKSVGGKININNRHQFVSEVAKYAKQAKDSHIIESMLSKSSVISAISIDNVKSIYDSIDVTKTYVRKEIPEEKETLSLKIKLDPQSEADKCMFTALALLVRAPDKLVEITPREINDKFKPFMKELGARYVYYKNKNVNWRFIAEDYTDSDFAKALQNKRFLGDPKEDIDSTASQYTYLFNKANEIYKNESEAMKRAVALSSIIDSTDPKVVAEILKLYKETQ